MIQTEEWKYGIAYQGTVEECLAAGLVTPDQVPDGVRCSSMTFVQGRRAGRGPRKSVDATYLKVCHHKGLLIIYRGSEEGQQKLLEDRAEERSRNARWKAVHALLPDDIPQPWCFVRPLAYLAAQRGGPAFSVFVLKAIGFSRGPIELPDNPRRPDAAAG